MAFMNLMMTGDVGGAGAGAGGAMPGMPGMPGMPAQPGMGGMPFSRLVLEHISALSESPFSAHAPSRAV